jgi:histone deacetylase 1/2
MGDKLGGFNLTFEQRAKIFQKIVRTQIPLLVLGGGGYTIENVS